jgi:nucleoside-diphosphate kinase
MIKPDAVADGHIGAILGKIAEGGFKIKALKLTQLTVADAKKFYEVHAERPFYGELVEFHEFWSYRSCCFRKRQCS